MRNLKINLVVIFACLFAISCQSNDDDAIDDTNNEETPTSVNQDVYIQAKVNGEDFLSKDDSRFSAIRFIDIAGRKTYQLIGGDGETGINIQFNNAFDGPKTYNLKDFPGSDNVGLTYLINGKKTYAAGNGADVEKAGDGKITVTKFDGTYMEGTFEFEAVNPDWSDRSNPNYSDRVKVTNGKFRLK